MARSPSGVSMGVSGEAQMGQLPVFHVHTPPSHTTDSSQSGPQSMPVVVHGVPACGIFAGQPLDGAAQAHSGGLMVWQIGYWVPPLQSLHQQRVPLSYQQEILSLQVLPLEGGDAGHDAGSAGVAQPVALGCVTDQVLSALHSASVLHAGRGSSPQLQCAASLPNPDEASVCGGVQAEPSAGGAAGQEKPVEPPLPPVPLVDVFPLQPVTAASASSATPNPVRMPGE